MRKSGTDAALYMTDLTYDGCFYLTFLQTTPTFKFISLPSSSFFLLWFKGSAPHVCSNKSSIPDVMSAGDWLYGARAQTPALAHTRAQTFQRVFKLLLELESRARELSLLLDSRFPFRALKLSFTPSIFPLF